MSFFDKLTAFLPFGKKEENLEYFFALNIAIENLTATLWTIDGNELKILETASASFRSNDEIVTTVDKLLDQVLGLKELEPQKILFGVPNSWLSDENLKDEYLRLLRNLVKELELTPMAYVATSHALIHFLEKQEGIPETAILVGFEEHHLTVTAVRAGKLDGVKIIGRSDNSGSDIEKALLTFADVETLPSKILIYGPQALELEKLRPQLLSFPWMSKLSFLHFPKIDILGEGIEIKSVCLAGGSEINSNISYADQPLKKQVERAVVLDEEAATVEESDREDQELNGKKKEDDAAVKSESTEEESESVQEKDNFGFVVGDVANQIKDEAESEELEEAEEKELVVPQEYSQEVEDFETQAVSAPAIPSDHEHEKKLNLKFLLPKSFTNITILLGIVGMIVLLVGAYLIFPQADVKIFVEPRILEKDAQVISDPKQKEVNEDTKIIPGQIVETEISGVAKDIASGKKQVGDPAKGTIVIRNKTDSAINLSKGIMFTSSNGFKFSLDLTVAVASRSADDGTWGKATTTATATSIGADGNLSSGSDLTVTGFTTNQLVAKTEGNFSGGTSKDVTVISEVDQKRLLASLAADLRRQAREKLQEKLPNKKILEEGLSEEIVRKSYNKNISDQASEFSLNLTVRYKGTAFEDQDLKLIVSKLVTTQVPEGFQLNLSETETQADVAKLEKDGRLIFLARFKAKLIPNIDTDKIRNQIRFKTPSEVVNILKSMDNILGSEIKITPNLPVGLQRLPIWGKNIKIEVGLK